MSEDKKTLKGLDPKKPFYLAVTVGNLDGSVDRPDGVEGICDQEDEAVQILKDMNDSYPSLDGYIFHCIPIKRIWRGKVRVSNLK